MRLLLDTHVWLWSVLQPELVPGKVKAELNRPSNELWLSPISIWELLMLSERGRAVLNEEPESWVRRALSHGRLQEAPFTHEVALEIRKLGLTHGDPADRILVATALVLGLTLVTADKRLVNLRQVPVLPAN
jgi:PIN domain nuclease of toxin-antitoxin system